MSGLGAVGISVTVEAMSDRPSATPLVWGAAARIRCSDLGIFRVIEVHLHTERCSTSILRDVEAIVGIVRRLTHLRPVNPQTPN